MKNSLTTIFAGTVALILAGCGGNSEDSPGNASEPVKVLAWVGYDETEFVDRLEQQTGATVEVTTYVGGDSMYSQLSAAPAGTFDIVIVDQEYGPRAFDERLITVVPESAIVENERFTVFTERSITETARGIYGVPVRWGALGLVYNTNELTPDQVQSYSILTDQSLTRRVGIFDWWLPNMAVFSKYLGQVNQWQNESSFSLSPEQLSELESFLNTLKGQVGTLQPTTGELIAALRSGSVYVSPGVGEWAAAALRAEGLPIDWTVPIEGGIMWIEAAALTPSGVERPEAIAVFRAIQDPSLNAVLMWRDAYVSQSPYVDAYDHLSTDQLEILKATNISDLDALASQLEVRRLPGPEGSTTPLDWQRAWRAIQQ